MSEKIIKPAAKVVKSETYAAAIEAAQIVEAAHAQARRIQEDAEQARQQAMEVARSEGYEHGLREWNAAVAEVNAARDKYSSDNAPELIRLAIRIAQKIVSEELRMNPEAIVWIARECLRGVGRERLLKIRVPADDLELVRKRIVLLREAAGPNRSIEVAGDSAISAGGCVVESEYGVIDARLETQLRCMEEVLLRAAGK
jgi:flagellar biosynthesis/type III secretory pathway protein FliH